VSWPSCARTTSLANVHWSIHGKSTVSRPTARYEQYWRGRPQAPPAGPW
jgi:hypothetical protein